MSDLNKSLFNKIKRHEQAIGGLPTLSENDIPDQISDQGAHTDRSANDHEIISRMEAFKSVSFDKAEVLNVGNALFKTYYKAPKDEHTAIFVCHHGAGSSAMTFALLAEVLTTEGYGILLFDARGHGLSGYTEDFSLQTLTEDFKSILDHFINTQLALSNTIYLVGHSLGGAVMANYLKVIDPLPPNLKGFAMIDIVEETAVRTLNTMPLFVQRRPKQFKSLEIAIEWHLKEIMLLFNRRSAELSVPDLLVKSANGTYLWKTDLSLTQPFWSTWFENLSQNFIESGHKDRVAKLLLLSAHETLDKELMIGQMQGKYQLVVFNNTTEAGHFLQEDIPNHIAQTLISFATWINAPNENYNGQSGLVPLWRKIH